MAVTAMLVAVTVICNRLFSFLSIDTKIGISFIPIMICGMMFGPLWGGVCAGLGDFIAAILFPLGIYHPGITLTAVLSGVVYGFMGLAADKIQKPLFFAPVAAGGVIVEKLICTLLINSLWISQLSGNPYLVQIAARIPQAAILLMPEIVLAVLVKALVIPRVKKTLK